jgi:hypothetical protein
MIRIAITEAAFEAIARTLPFGNVFENKTDEDGNRLIWLDRAVIERLRWLRGPGESYSNVILSWSRLGRGRRRAPHRTGSAHHAMHKVIGGVCDRR